MLICLRGNSNLRQFNSEDIIEPGCHKTLRSTTLATHYQTDGRTDGDTMRYNSYRALRWRRAGKKDNVIAVFLQTHFSLHVALLIFISDVVPA